MSDTSAAGILETAKTVPGSLNPWIGDFDGTLRDLQVVFRGASSQMLETRTSNTANTAPDGGC